MSHVLGKPSVASTMIGGEPVTGGVARKSSRMASIDSGVGVSSNGVWLCSMVARGPRLSSARGTVISLGHGGPLGGALNNAAPKYTLLAKVGSKPVPGWISASTMAFHRVVLP